MYKKWTKIEEDYLIELYADLGLSLIELYPIFNEKYNRSSDSVWLKIKRMKLKHSTEQTKEIKSRLNSGDKNGMFGKIGWNYGLTKENSNIIKDGASKLSETKKIMYKNGELVVLKGEQNPMYGKTPWSKGLNKYTDARLKNAGIKISANKKIEWMNKSDENKEKIIKRLNKMMISKRPMTKIEKKMAILLGDLNINYERNYPIDVFLVDFYLPKYNLVIECDGDYWHGNPELFKPETLNETQNYNIKRDIRKNETLTRLSIPFVRFWEHDINSFPKEVKNKILELIN